MGGGDATLWQSVSHPLVSFEDAINLALATYTTPGYGDTTVGAEYRLLVAMAAATGLQNFGLSTAFLVGLVSQMIAASEDKT